MRSRIGWIFEIMLSIFLISTSFAGAQDNPAERNATQQEITGDWQLLPLPDSLEPKAFKSNPWPATCQWYSYSATGTLKSIDAINQPCRPFSSKQLDEALTAVPATVSWKYDLSPVYQKALIIISRSDVQHYAEYWMPHIVTKAFSRDGVEFREGDLLLYLVNMQEHKVVWIRHLRKMS
jgi:hypothetical protein